MDVVINGGKPKSPGRWFMTPAGAEIYDFNI